MEVSWSDDEPVEGGIFNKRSEIFLMRANGSPDVAAYTTSILAGHPFYPSSITPTTDPCKFFLV